MATFTEKIRVVIDVSASNAKKVFTDLRTDVAKADGAMGKFKAGVGSLGSSFKDMAKNPAVAGAAVAAVGVAAIAAADQFADLALEVGRFSDASGLAAEDASRWVEVAGDIGIEAATVEKSIGKMNKELGGSPEKFAALGVEIVRTKDGAVDANATFLNAIDTVNRMTDPTKKAALAAQIFGRGWQEMAELINKGAPELRASLAAVSDAKVIDDGEVAKARKYRAAMDELGDKFQDFAMTIGEAVLPVLTDLVGVLTDVAEGIEWVGDKIGALDFMPSVLDEITKGWDLTEKSVESTNRQLDRSADAMAGAREAAQDLKDEQLEQAEATREQLAAFQDVLGMLPDAEKAMLALADSVDKTAEAERNYATISADSQATAEEKAAALRDLRSAQIDSGEAALQAALAYATANGAAKGTTESYGLQLVALEDMKQKYPLLGAEIDRYIAKLKLIPGVVNTKVSIQGGGLGIPISGKFDTGGVVGGPRGSEQLILAHGGETVLPTHKTGFAGMAGSGAGNTYNVTVNAPSISPDDVQRAIAQWNRLNGVR